MGICWYYCKTFQSIGTQTVMASGRVRTGIRPGTNRYLSGPGSGRFSNMVRSGRVSPASVKYPRNLGRPPEPVRTDRVFISMSMSVQGSRFVDCFAFLDRLQLRNWSPVGPIEPQSPCCNAFKLDEHGPS